MGKFNFEESPVKKAAEEIRDRQDEPQQGRVEAQSSAQVPVQTVAQPPVVQSDPIPYNEVLKNVGAKIPYSVYDRLERIKRQSERSGIKADKRNIGDLIAQAIKEFVEKYDIHTLR